VSRFLSPLHLARTGPREAILLADFRYSSDIAQAVITAPEGFGIDGASVPRVAWSFVSPFGRILRATVIHDLLYDTRGRWEAVMRAILGTDTGEAARKLADDIFWEAMKVDRVPPWNVTWFQREGSYRAVRAFGREAWET
jgi:hypothetical protein